MSTTHADTVAAISGFAAASLADTRIVLDEAETRSFGTDATGLYSGPVICAMSPATTSDVSQILRFCNEHGIAVVPQGGNTSSSGGAVPGPGTPAVVLRLNRMNRILSIDVVGDTIEVEAGVVLARMKEELDRHGLAFPLGIGSEGSCQIGGNIATNAGGSTVLRYGMMRDSVLGLEVVLADGSILQNLYALRKVRLGYDLNSIFVGSEGTLGVITRAVLKVQRTHKADATAWLAVADLEDVMEIVQVCQRAFGDKLTCFEVMSRRLREVVIDSLPGACDPFAGSYEWAALIELRDQGEPEPLADDMERVLADLLGSGLAGNAVIAQNDAQRQTFWTIRDGFQQATNRYGWAVMYDSSVPLSAIPAFAETAQRRVSAAFPDAEFVAGGHAGDGNIHIGFLFARRHIASRADYDAIEAAMNAIVFRCAHELGGVFASEHPIGVHHTGTLAQYASDVHMRLMRDLKATLDPRGILNPGKVLG